MHAGSPIDSQWAAPAVPRVHGSVVRGAPTSSEGFMAESFETRTMNYSKYLLDAHTCSRVWKCLALFQVGFRLDNNNVASGIPT